MNELIKLPTEVQLRINTEAQNKTDEIFNGLENLSPAETMAHLLVAYADLIKKTEANKWFAAERSKNTFNEMVTAYDAEIKRLNEVIQKKVERLNP